MTRVAVLAGSNYSERGIATVVALSAAGFEPVTCLCRVAANRYDIARKVAQYGVEGILRYAVRRLGLGTSRAESRFENPWLEEIASTSGSLPPSTLAAACRARDVPLNFCRDVNGEAALGQLRDHAPDVLVYTGGGILRKPLIELPRIGVINAHSGVLPRYRGMSVMEWAILEGDEPGVTVHFIDPGIDTGRILFVCRVPVGPEDASLLRLRRRMVAATVHALVEGVARIDEGCARGSPQAPEDGRQYFVMHDKLRELAEGRLVTRIASTA